MENRNIHHPETGQGSGQQHPQPQPHPPVPNPIVPNVPPPNLQLVVPLIAVYQYSAAVFYGTAAGPPFVYYYHHYYHYYHYYLYTVLPNGGVVFWPTFPAPFPPIVNVNDPNIRHHDPPRLEAVPEDEVVAPEILGHAEVDEDADELEVPRYYLGGNSYEELLALAEMIGNVSIGLSSEFIERNLNDEFKAGENIGTLECSHEYHKHCIKRWLLGHNTCPLCMSPALRVD
ncbi:probable E3 ubiquitin-protein ligase ZFP1 isoform X2 [Salvia splendens]|uniref:probable E3 ubiquitin-protein ligase ZFP1 isoform X2 n=1 Tax=Salvia splendens TaxID=180675 RepID=UPI001C27BE8D|nr:probable E3 ubiquitin-protein ligase ZFP1 isoform X2 [Salvia splendens]